MMVYPDGEAFSLLHLKVSFNTKAPTMALVLQYMIFVGVSIQSHIAYFSLIPDFSTF